MVDRVSLVYTHFNSLSARQRWYTYIAFDSTGYVQKKRKQSNYDYLYEPSPDEVFDVLLPAYINNIRILLY